MIVQCPGGWVDEFPHEPVTVGEKEPLDKTTISHGCCDACLRAMGQAIRCRLCNDAETPTGLCMGCQRKLMTDVGVPTMRLTVYRQSGALSCSYDGAGAMERLRFAMRQDGYRAFALERLMTAGAK